MQIKTTTHADRQTDRHRNVSPDSSANRNYVIQNYAFYPGQDGSIAERNKYSPFS